VTPAKNLPSIERFGILRGDGAVFNRDVWSRGKVFLSTSREAAMLWMDYIYETTWEDVAMIAVRLPEPLVARLEVDARAQDDGIPGAVYLRHDVPLECLVDVLYVGPGSAYEAVESVRSTPVAAEPEPQTRARRPIRWRPV
jgi:hypothetical protein